MKIALAQMEVIAGRPDKNVANMLSMIEEAKYESADLVVFPEMAVGGYLLGDKFLEDEFCKDLMAYNEELQKASKGIALAYGNIFVDDKSGERAGGIYSKAIHPNKDGRSRKYNAIYVFQNGKPAERLRETMILPEGVQPKTLLPNYRFFDDERYFFSLGDVAKDFGVELKDLTLPFKVYVEGKEHLIGFELCEDLWCEDYRKDGRALNITKFLVENGAEKIINLSASPWTFGKNGARDRRIKFLREDVGDSFVPFYYVNIIGVQNNGKNIITFDGGTTVYNKDADPIVLSREAYKQELILVKDKDLEGKVLSREEKPRIAQKYDAIIRGIRHIKDIYGAEEFPRFVVGMSGGIDSSVVSALLVKAIGPSKVFGINMPTRFNSDKTKDSAREVAENLGIGYGVIPVEELTNLNIRILNEADLEGSGRKLNALQEGNVAAKIRGTAILSNLAARYNAIFTNNGNKLEVALGYATLYGDWGGAIAPIADLTKTEVVEMANYLNDVVFSREIIPARVIPNELWQFKKDQIIPSAELEFDQIDPMKFGYHCALLNAMTDYMKKTPSDVMKWYLQGTLEKNLGIKTELIKRWKINSPPEFVKDLEWFYSTVQRNIFKRVQAPPIIVTSKSAYGYDIRESMLPYVETKEYEKLKGKVLAMKSYISGGKNG